MMEKLNPNFNKVIETEEDLLGNENNLSGDVRFSNQLRTPAQKTALSRVNSQREFNEAFESWFGTLGVSTEQYKNKLKIATTISFITDVLKKNGIQF